MNNLFAFSANMLAEPALGDGASIVITIAVFLAAVGLSVLLFFRTKKERTAFKEDVLNGNALNKEKFDEIIQARFKYANIKTKFTVFYLQLNNAKEIKETFGENQYKTAINEIKSRVYDVFGKAIKLSNYTYDSLTALVDKDLGRTETEDYCKFLIAECNKAVKLVGNLSIEFDVNIGVASYDTYNQNYVSFWQNLELALVASIRSGLNKFVIHSAELENQQSEEYKYYQEVKYAIEHNDFTVYYQTLVNFDDDKTVAYESLLRWNHKTLGLLSPERFLNILEQSGDINWVGMWAYEQVLLQCVNWQQTYGEEKVIVSINLSSKQLANEKLFDEIRQITRKYKIEPARICFEIMEFALFDKMTTVKNNIEQLSKAGFLIAIDNYGLELNTLSVLHQIKVNMIKLDREFTAQIKDNSLNSGIVNMLINYAKENDVKLVAMGVETAEMKDFLKGLGVHYGQGYYFSKPRSGKECSLDFS